MDETRAIALAIEGAGFFFLTGLCPEAFLVYGLASSFHCPTSVLAVLAIEGSLFFRSPFTTFPIPVCFLKSHILPRKCNYYLLQIWEWNGSFTKRI